jgi:hypothetical protein
VVPSFTALGQANEMHDAPGVSHTPAEERAADVWLKAGGRFDSGIEKLLTLRFDLA